MAEQLNVLSTSDRSAQYASLLPQIRALIAEEDDEIANLANVAAALKEAFGFFWVGFYRVDDAQLVLGPFQGPIACTRIQKGKGVCGTVWAEAETRIVPDVNEFPGHIACNGASQSEIVVPIFDADEAVKMVLDIDSNRLNDFSSIDQRFLEELVKWL